MTPDPLLVLTLKEAAEGYLYHATCTSCRRHIKVDLKALAAQLGESYPVRDIRRRLKCECGAKNPIISMIPNSVTWAPNWHAAETRGIGI